MSVKLFGGNEYLELKFWKFPAGERNVKIVEPILVERYKSFTIEVKFEGSDDLMDMMLLVNAIRNVSYSAKIGLRIPYFPFARQDRVMTEGEPFALQVAVDMIKMCNFNYVETWDAHSDVLAGMFPAGLLINKKQDDLLINDISRYIESDDNTALIAPDAGALKKIYPLASRLGVPVIVASKTRDVTNGNITGVTIDMNEVLKYNNLIVVDDICDGGRTFIELAKVVREKCHYEYFLQLHVTHGIFSKGKEELNKYFDVVNCVNDMSKGN